MYYVKEVAGVFVVYNDDGAMQFCEYATMQQAQDIADLFESLDNDDDASDTPLALP